MDEETREALAAAASVALAALSEDLAHHAALNPKGPAARARRRRTIAALLSDIAVVGAVLARMERGA